MRTSSRTLLAGVAATALVAGYAALASPAAPAHSNAPRATFGTPVVVDFFRPGYEPDVAVSPAGKYKGSTYVSVPNGFSTTLSYLWRSDDNRRSFHLTEGNAIGKEATCVGGGDTDLRVDPVNGALYFNDLQGLTNFTNSRSLDGGHTWTTSCTSVHGLGVDRQWIGIDSNGNNSAVGAGAKDGRLYFDYDNVAQDISGGAANQLVMNESVDGVNYGNKCEAESVPCLLPPAVITRDEGIPGNVIVDNVPGSPYQHRVYAIHTSGDAAQAGVIVSWCSGKKGDNTAAEVADSCTDPTAVDPTDAQHVNVYWHDSFARQKGAWNTGHLFPSLAIDKAGNLYAVWSEYPGGQNASGPGAIKMSVSRDGAQHWSKPVTISPPSLPNDVMPWITAGSKGRVGIAWYGSTTAKSADGAYGPDPVEDAYWNLYYSVSTDALSSSPDFGLTKVSDHPVKYGDISTGGLGGSQDRSLGDFMQVQMGQHGEAVITYVDDTSADRNQDTCGGCGETPAEAAGPVMVVTQNGGPSLIAGHRVPRSPKQFGRITNKPGDAFLSLGGQDIKAPPSLDVIGASIRQKDEKTLQITLSTNDTHLSKDLGTTPPLGGPVNTWMVRWAAPSYHKRGDGNQFYVGMQSAGGGAPTFYTGTTQAITTTHVKYFTYPAEHAIKGSIQGGQITWTLPLKLIDSPGPGDGLFSVTGFTSTQAYPSPTSTVTIPDQGGELGDANIPNLIGATAPFTYIVGR